MRIRTVMIVLATQRDALRMASVVLAMRRRPELRPVVVVCGNDPNGPVGMLTLFDITADFIIDVDEECRSTTTDGRGVLSGLEDLLAEQPDLMVVQGNAHTSCAAVLAAFFHRVPVLHVDDGLHSAYASTVPADLNRMLAMRLCALHLAATSAGAQQLVDEGIPPGSIVCTSDPVVDSVLLALETPLRRRVGLLDDLELHRGRARNPLGHGTAADRTIGVILHFFDIGPSPVRFSSAPAAGVADIPDLLSHPTRPHDQGYSRALPAGPGGPVRAVGAGRGRR